MLSVTGIWLYMLATTFLTGYGILQALTRYVPYRVRHKDTYLLCGLAAVTVYAQLFTKEKLIKRSEGTVFLHRAFSYSRRIDGRADGTGRAAGDR